MLPNFGYTIQNVAIGDFFYSFSIPLKTITTIIPSDLRDQPQLIKSPNQDPYLRITTLINSDFVNHLKYIFALQ